MKEFEMEERAEFALFNLLALLFKLKAIDRVIYYKSNFIYWGEDADI